VLFPFRISTGLLGVVACANLKSCAVIRAERECVRAEI